MDKQKKSRKSAEIINPGLGDIEKVRDILFGKYVASFEERFTELEARLESDIDKLKDRLSDKIESMDDEVNKALQKLDVQIGKERKDRDSELNSLQGVVSTAEENLKQSIALMEDQANQDLKAVREAIATTHQELIDQLQSQKDALESDKVGRQALALMLDEVAVKLRGSK